MSTYRFEARSTTPGQYRFKTGFYAGLPGAANVLNGVDRGDGSTGALSPVQNLGPTLRSGTITMGKTIGPRS